MSENEKAETPVAVIGNFSFTLPAPNSAQLSVSGYLYSGESKESLDDRMDVCRESLMRQQRLLEIPVLEAHLEQLEKARTDIMAAYADLLERQKLAPKSMPSQEQANLKNYPMQLKSLEQQLGKAQQKIAEARSGT